MATRRQPLNLRGLMPGLFAATLLCAVALAAFLALWFSAPGAGWQSVFSDSYLWHVVRFSFWQASLSALISVGPAIFLARALYRRRFPGRTLLLRLCAMTLILPVLVAVFGILSVYGRQGWLASLFNALGWQWEFSPYGLQGILLAHVFFNMPMATRLLLQALENIPAVAALIFMLCFASFATVLSLGGGPKATTIELAIYQALSFDYDPARAAMLALIQMLCCLGLVLLSQRLSIELAIYQALSFDYDPARAAMLALIQMLCCLGLVLLSQRLSKAVAIGVSHVRGWCDPDDRLHSRLSDGLLIGAALLLLLPPLLAVIVDGINRNMLDVLAQPALWQALSTSLRIAIAAGLLSVTLTMMLLWSSRELRARQRPLAGQAMELSGMLILAMPGIVLATGFFLLLNKTIGLPESADGIVIFTNALMAIPYALKVLENPMRDIAARYSMLCQSLGIEGFARLRVVELRALRRPLAQALAFACVLSIGDFGVVALFGNEAFRTLPFYLYQQIGAYRSQDGAVTALLLLLLCFLLFTLIEKLPGRDAKTQ
ncbi:thiamine/thiamine pyrophosphate ABC transporter, permease protein [Klebsiella pneumoniae]|nr:thiamine/thiamine pyrophosphate ABC transporter, permease protein [Klebsiella pneumoniae]